MIKNYIKTAWRSLTSNKTYSSLNILGLATGLGVALMIGLWIYYQFSFDRFLPGFANVYKAGILFNDDNGDKQVQLITAYPLADAIKKDVPGVKYVTHTDWIKQHGLVAGDTKLYMRGAMAGSDFLKIFQYPLVKGNADQVLQNTYSIVLTESTAKALFGNQDPINKIVRIDNQNDLKVTGVLKDIPKNSTLQFNYIVPFDYFINTDEGVKRATTNWGQVTFQTYISLEPNVSYAQITPALNTILAKYKITDKPKEKPAVFLHPLKSWHLYADFKNAVAGGFIDYVKMFAVIGLLVLLIACINFINLSTARAEKRAKEVGIRKVIGSRRSNLIFQFLTESVLLTLCAFVIAMIIVRLCLPMFNRLTDSDVSLPYSNPLFWSLMAGYILITALLAGSRPAFYLSSFRPIKVLKGLAQNGKAALLPRKILVVTQFTCSIALIISTIIIYQQIQHAKDRPIGFDTNRLLMTNASPDLKRNYPALKHDLLQSGFASSVTAATSPVTENKNFNSIVDWPGKGDDKELGVATVAVADSDYFKTMGMPILEGRNFTNPGDTLNVILNESAVKRLKLKDPVNQVIVWDGVEKARVIGIVKDALMSSPFSAPDPTLFAYHPDWMNIVTYRLATTANTAKAIGALTPIFARYNPFYPYIFDFADEKLQEKFKLELLVGKLSGIFAALAIFISCLGLFSLAAYTAEQRKKEIGIRKVLGASISQVWMLLTKEFVVLVLLSAMIASPITLYFIQGWLEKYGYRVSIGPIVFVAAAVVAIVLTIVTISFQAIKTATMNPVKSIRTE